MYFYLEQCLRSRRLTFKLESLSLIYYELILKNILLSVWHIRYIPQTTMLVKYYLKKETYSKKGLYLRDSIIW